MYIGKRIKELRKVQGMKLIELAEKSGVQIATLSRIEHMKMPGTLESHIKIAKALGVDITQLYTDIISEEAKVDIMEPQKKTDFFIHSDKSSYEILTSKLMNKKMMPVLLKIEPGGQTNKEQYSPVSERFIFVLEGKIEAHIGARSFPLSKNHSLYFDASAEHLFINKGTAMAKMVSVLTPVSL